MSAALADSLAAGRTLAEDQLKKVFSHVRDYLPVGCGTQDAKMNDRKTVDLEDGWSHMQVRA